MTNPDDFEPDVPDKPASLWFGVIMDENHNLSITFIGNERKAHALAKHMDKRFNPSFHADVFDTEWFEKRLGLSARYDDGGYTVMRLTERMLRATGLSVISTTQLAKMRAVIDAARDVARSASAQAGQPASPLFTHLHQKWVKDALDARREREEAHKRAASHWDIGGDDDRDGGCESGDPDPNKES